MYTFEYSTAFVRDVKTYAKHGGDREKLQNILQLLAQGNDLPPSLRDHQLHGRLRQYRELHVESDWLLVYRKDGKKTHHLLLLAHDPQSVAATGEKSVRML